MFSSEEVRLIRRAATAFPRHEGQPPTRAQLETLVTKAETCDVEEVCLDMDARLDAGKFGAPASAERIARLLEELLRHIWDGVGDGACDEVKRERRMKAANALRYVNKIRGRPFTETIAAEAKQTS